MPLPTYLSSACQSSWVDRCSGKFQDSIRCTLPEGHSGDHKCHIAGSICTSWKTKVPRCTAVEPLGHNVCTLDAGHPLPHKSQFPSGGSVTFFIARGEVYKRRSRGEPLPDKSWWVAWWSPWKDFEMTNPWWAVGAPRIGGFRKVCAAIKAPTVQAVKEFVRKSYDADPGDLDFEFIRQYPADWTPFNSFFVKQDWMIW